MTAYATAARDMTDDEAALYYHVSMGGSECYPIQKFSGRWQIGPFRGWRGFPVCYKTKKAAVAQFEAWMAGFRERWAEFRRHHPNAILTAVGIKGVDQ